MLTNPQRTLNEVTTEVLRSEDPMLVTRTITF